MSGEAVVQSWYRILHCIGNPVDLCRPQVISQTPDFLQVLLYEQYDMKYSYSSVGHIIHSHYVVLTKTHIVFRFILQIKPYLKKYPLFQYSITGEEGGRDPSQHPCLRALPDIFLKAMKGLAAHVDAFLGIYFFFVLISFKVSFILY